MRHLLMTFLVLFVAWTSSAQEWKLVYEHDEQGQVLQGSKQALIDAVRAGKDVKIGWKMGGGEQSVEHFAEVQFLSILKGEVFGQISKILSQMPSFQKVTVDFLEGMEWSMIASTSGKNATIMQSTDGDPKKFSQMYLWGNKWFVR